jgi:hypothetical protein
LVFVFFAFAIEVGRQFIPSFQRDRERWLGYDQRAAEREERDGASPRESDHTVDEEGVRHLVVSPDKM